MKKTFLAYGVYFVLLFTFSGCKKVDLSLPKYETVDEVMISKLRNWVNDKKVTANTQQVDGLDSLLINAKWNQTILNRVSKEKSLFYVPLNNTTVGLEFFYDNQSRQIDSGNIIKTSVNSLQKSDHAMRAITTYYETVILKMSSSQNFTGSISAYSILNSFLYDYNFSKGEIISRGIVVPKLNLGNTLKKRSNSVSGKKLNAEYTCETWGHFTLWTSGLVTLDYTYLVCTSCVTTSIGISTGQQYIKSNCSSSGGTPADPVPLINFWNNLTNPCLKQLLENVMSNAYQLTYDVLQTQYPNSAYTAFNYVQMNLGSTGNIITNGATSPMINTAPDNRTYINIILNADVLPFVSQEYAAVTMMHEALHAMIVAGGTLVASNFIHHNEIANNYVEIMAADLRATFSNLSAKDSYALAWSGLNFRDTNAWNALSESLRIEYDQILEEYWMNGTKGTRPTNCN